MENAAPVKNPAVADVLRRAIARIDEFRCIIAAMHDRWLIAIALGTSSIGLALLMIALLFFELPHSTIPEVALLADGAPAHVQGEVMEVQRSGERSIFRIRQETFLPVVIEGNASVQKGACIDVQGKRSSFSGVAQIDASVVRLCDPKKGDEQS